MIFLGHRSVSVMGALSNGSFVIDIIAWTGQH